MMKTLDNDSMSNEACVLDAIEQFIRDKRISLQHKEDLARQINAGLKLHGRSWLPLYELFEPMRLLPTDAKCNGVKRDSFYGVSKIAIGRIDLYMPVMKRLAMGCKKESKEDIDFAKNEYGESDAWNQLRNFFNNLQKADMVSVSSNNSEVLSVCPNPKHLPFFDGGWAEDGMVYLIEKTIKSFSAKQGLPSHVFWNVKLSDNPPWNLTRFEFDVIAKIGKMFYVFEVKTGALLSIDKWFERWSIFKDVGARYIQCTTKEVDHKLFVPLPLFPIEHFETLLEQRLEKDIEMMSN
jgi:hypothetical protein